MYKLFPLIVILVSSNVLAFDYSTQSVNSSKYKYESPNLRAQKDMLEFNKSVKNAIVNSDSSSVAVNSTSVKSNQYNVIDSNNLPIPMDAPNIILPPKEATSKYKNLFSISSQTNGCWDGAARAYKLDPWLLMAIAKVESSFNNNAINTNKNSTTDIGMMQINTIWLPTLQKFGIYPKDLVNPCTSIFVGAWILAQNIKNYGYNLDGIGAYNSPSNVRIRREYAKKVYKAYNEITNDLYYRNQNLTK